MVVIDLPRGTGLTRTLFGGIAKDAQFGVPANKDDAAVIVHIPDGVTEVIVQGRQCGDYYAEISGGRVKCTSAIGISPLAAFNAALAQVQA